MSESQLKNYAQALEQWTNSAPAKDNYKITAFATAEEAATKFRADYSEWEANTPVKSSYTVGKYRTATEAKAQYEADLLAWNNGKPQISDSRYSVGKYKTAAEAKAQYELDLKSFEAGKPNKNSDEYSVGYATAEAAKAAYDAAKEEHKKAEPKSDNYVFATKTYQDQYDAIDAYNEAKSQYDAYETWKNSAITDYDTEVGMVYVYNGKIYASLSDANKAKADAMPTKEGSKNLDSYLSNVNKYTSAEEASEALKNDKASYEAYSAWLSKEDYDIKEVYQYNGKYYSTKAEARAAAKEDNKPEEVASLKTSLYKNNKGCSSQEEMNELYNVELEKYKNNEIETAPDESDYVYHENKYDSVNDAQNQYTKDLQNYNDYSEKRLSYLKSKDSNIKVYIQTSENTTEYHSYFWTCVKDYLTQKKVSVDTLVKHKSSVKACVTIDGSIKTNQLRTLLTQYTTIKNASVSHYFNSIHKAFSDGLKAEGVTIVTSDGTACDTLLAANYAAYDMKYAREDDVTIEPVLSDYAYYYATEEEAKKALTAANDKYKSELEEYNKAVEEWESKAEDVYDSNISIGYTLEQQLPEDGDEIYSSREDALTVAKAEAKEAIPKGFDGELVTESIDETKYYFHDNKEYKSQAMLNAKYEADLAEYNKYQTAVAAMKGEGYVASNYYEYLNSVVVAAYESYLWGSDTDNYKIEYSKAQANRNLVATKIYTLIDLSSEGADKIKSDIIAYLNKVDDQYFEKGEINNTVSDDLYKYVAQYNNRYKGYNSGGTPKDFIKNQLVNEITEYVNGKFKEGYVIQGNPGAGFKEEKNDTIFENSTFADAAKAAFISIHESEEKPDLNSEKYTYYYDSEQAALDAYTTDSANAYAENYASWNATTVDTKYYLVSEDVEKLTEEDIDSDKDTMLNKAKENAKVEEVTNPDAEGVKESQYTYYDDNKQIFDSKDKKDAAYNEAKSSWESSEPKESDYTVGNYETEAEAEAAYKSDLDSYLEANQEPDDKSADYSVGNYSTNEEANTQLKADIDKYIEDNGTEPDKESEDYSVGYASSEEADKAYQDDLDSYLENNQKPDETSDTYSVGEYQTEEAANKAYETAVENYEASEPSIEDYATEENKAELEEASSSWEESEPSAEDYSYDHVDTESYDKDLASWEESKPQE